MPDEVESTRDVLSGVWDKLDAASTPAPEPAAPVTEAAAPVSTESTPQASDDRPRGPDGKFVKKEAGEAPKGNDAPRATDSGAPEAAAVPAGPPPAPAAPPASVSLKAPQSWTPEEREEFAKASPAVQKAALRREAEITRALNETAEPRKLRDAVAPYEHLFRSQGLTAQQGVGSILQTYAALRTAPPQVKAQVLGQLIRDNLGTDDNAINLLAASIQGQPQQPAYGPEQFQAEFDRRFQEREAAAEREAATALVQQFQATKPEHLESVRKQMGVVINAWRDENPGQRPTMETLQEAYNTACYMNSEVREIEKQKKDAEQAKTQNAATQRAKASAVSVKSSPAGPAIPPPPGDDTRSHIEAAWERAQKQ